MKKKQKHFLDGLTPEQIRKKHLVAELKYQNEQRRVEAKIQANLQKYRRNTQRN